MTFKKEIKKHFKGKKIFLILIATMMLISIGCFCFAWDAINMKISHKKYEKTAAEHYLTEQEYNKRYTYEILSIEEYIQVTTNNWGAVVDQSPAYSIWYKNSNHEGCIDLIEDIRFTEYGNHKMVLTEDIDTITFKEDGGVIVRLTEETMRGM